MYKDSDFKSFYHIKEKNKKNSVLSALFVVKFARRKKRNERNYLLKKL